MITHDAANFSCAPPAAGANSPGTTRVVPGELAPAAGGAQEKFAASCVIIPTTGGSLRRNGTAGKSYCEVEALSRARGGHSWFNPGWREGVSSHCGEECPLPTNRHHKVQALSLIH